MRITILFILSILSINIYCNAEPNPKTRVIHVFVALADNASQGIVPVPPKIGNGDIPEENLYWGCDEGLKSQFKNSKDWKLLQSERNLSPQILERLIFSHAGGVYLVADAYRGSEIKHAILALLNAAAGIGVERIKLNSAGNPIEIEAGGGADLVAYIGHNGLMDFKLDVFPTKVNERKRDAIVLCCISRAFFQPALEATGANPLLLTTQLMYPGSFILKSALDGWIANESAEQIRDRAAEAYAKNQGISMKAAKGLLVTGW